MSTGLVVSSLVGLPVPTVRLLGHDGVWRELREASHGVAIFYVYPSTGFMGVDPAPNWDDYPGAPGCTVQSLGFNALFSEFQAHGVTVLGISSQSREEQERFADHNGIQFPLLSDPHFDLASKMSLSTFYAGDRRFYRRIVIIAANEVVVHAFQPPSDPGGSAETALAWIRQLPNRQHRD